MLWLTLALLASSLCQTLSAADLRDPEISPLIAKKLREFHDLDMPGPRDVSLWQRLRYGMLSHCCFSDFVEKCA
jgi:hypothetical protein